VAYLKVPELSLETACLLRKAGRFPVEVPDKKSRNFSAPRHSVTYASRLLPIVADATKKLAACSLLEVRPAVVPIGNNQKREVKAPEPPISVVADRFCRSQATSLPSTMSHAVSESNASRSHLRASACAQIARINTSILLPGVPI
jgi:hypothetical protein